MGLHSQGQLRELSLFTGAGGGVLGSILLGWKVCCYVEIDKYRQRVIQARIRDGLIDDAPIWDDIRTFNGKPWRGLINVVSAGFPCQPFSVAGQQKAQDDERNLWPDTIRVIGEVRPEWCLLENVSGLLAGSHGYFGQILQELAESGYDASWKVLSAAEVGAPHKRDRLWVVGWNADSVRCDWNSRQKSSIQNKNANANGIGETVAHTKAIHAQGYNQGQRQGKSGRGSWWATEPALGRVATGVAHRVDRLKALGDGQVPKVVEVIWRLLVEGAVRGVGV